MTRHCEADPAHASTDHLPPAHRRQPVRLRRRETRLQDLPTDLAPLSPHYRAGEWTFAKGALCTIDRNMLGPVGPYRALNLHAWSCLASSHPLPISHARHLRDPHLPPYPLQDPPLQVTTPHIVPRVTADLVCVPRQRLGGHRGAQGLPRRVLHRDRREHVRLALEELPRVPLR